MKLAAICFSLLATVAVAEETAPINGLYIPPDDVVFIHNCQIQLKDIAPAADVQKYCGCMANQVGGKIMLYRDENRLNQAKRKCRNYLLEQYDRNP